MALQPFSDVENFLSPAVDNLVMRRFIYFKACVL